MMSAYPIAEPDTRADIQPGNTPFDVRCAGAWVLHGIKPLEHKLAKLTCPDGGELLIDASAVTAMDTSGAWMLHRTMRTLQEQGRRVQVRGLRPEFEALLRLIAARSVSHQAAAVPSVLSRIGQQSWRSLLSGLGMLSFLGENAIVLLRSLGGGPS